VKCCGVATAMPQGQRRVPPPSNDQQVNTGTIPVLPGLGRSQRPVWVGFVVDRSGRGGTEPPEYSEAGRAGRMGKGGSGDLKEGCCYSER
jgi:hypothetical protein